MLSNFLLTEELPDVGVHSTVAWARKPQGKVLIFVHGFGGSAVATWSSFLSLLSQEPKLAGWDVIFYGYDGLHTRAIASAHLFRKFLTNLRCSPKAMYERSGCPESARQVHPATYTETVIAAHSLGAVVSRRAMLDIHRSPPTQNWANTVRLVLFAPAHKGATVRKWVEASPLGALSCVVPLLHVFGKLAVLDDLQIGSSTLTDLAADLASQYNPATSANLRAAAVFHAEREIVVELAALLPDLPATIMQGCDHNTICKPSFSQRDSFDALVVNL